MHTISNKTRKKRKPHHITNTTQRNLDHLPAAQQGQVVPAHGDGRVVRAERFLVDCCRPLVTRLCLIILTLRVSKRGRRHGLRTSVEYMCGFIRTLLLDCRNEVVVYRFQGVKDSLQIVRTKLDNGNTGKTGASKFPVAEVATQPFKENVGC